MIRSLRPSEPDPPGEPKRYLLAGKKNLGYVRLRWKVGPRSYVERYERDESGGAVRLLPLQAKRIDLGEVARLHGLGWSQPQIARATDTDAGNISRALRRLGLQARRAQDYLDLPPRERITRLYEDGVSGVDIARLLDCSTGHVYGVLREEGIMRRPGKNKRKITTYETELKRLEPLVQERSQGLCEVSASEKCTGVGAHKHHRKRRGQGGENELSNILHCCIYCHMVIHNIGEQAYANGWLVKSHDDPALVTIKRGTRDA